MKLGLCGNATFLVASSLFLGYGAWSVAADAEFKDRLSLADLAKYRAALTGKAVADDARASEPPARVSFKDLWNRPDAFRGLRVMIEGRVQRIFRQGPVGSFPPLAEIWIASPAGDPFCLVVPQESSTGSLPVGDHGLESRATPRRVPKPGQAVRFTGTFLKMIRYAAGDGARLAPLVVGDQPPAPAPEAAKANGAGHLDNGLKHEAGSPASWLLALIPALLAAGLLAWRHLHERSPRAGPRRRRRSSTASSTTDPPLEFIESREKGTLLYPEKE